jgi:hypothetical protein
MKIIINEEQFNVLLKKTLIEQEEKIPNDYSISLFDKPLSEGLKKYGGGTDSIRRICGRSTGHFGSGTYFSTYKNENEDIYNKYILDDNDLWDNKELFERHLKNKKENLPYFFIYNSNEEKKGIIVNLNKYNLYRPDNFENAQILFDALKISNEMCCFYHYSNKIKKEYYNKLKSNFKILGLGLPNEDDLKDKLNEFSNDFDSKAESFSTYIIENMGYNGINVNNMKKFDDTYHGSVIYDLSVNI